MTTTKAKAEPGDFAAFLASSRPNTNRELADELSKLVGKIRDTGKGGVLTLVLTIKPQEGTDFGLIVNDEIKVKAPEHSRKPSFVYSDGENHLSRTDPSSMPLFDEDLREANVDLSTGEVREAGDR